jgi:hypothetical protein
MKTRTRSGASWATSASRGLSAGAVLLSVLTAGCAGGPSPRPLPAASLSPWQIPQGAYGSQRLYRVSYSGPEGEGSFRVTLRLASPARYQLQAVDPIGRGLWSLDVSNDSGLWLNHRNKSYCQFEGRFDVSGVPMGPFPLLSLPSLLLGRVPADPAAGSPTAEPRGREFDFRDETGRRWYGALGEEGQVLSWTLAEGSTPKVWWMRREDWAILSDRERNVQVRWREALRENLNQEPPRLETPAGYRLIPCGEQEVPEPEPPGD